MCSAPANQTLTGFRLFDGVENATLDEMTARAGRRKLRKGELIFDAGDLSDAMYAVLDGRVRIWSVSPGGVEITLNVLNQGALFGEIGLLDGGQRTAAASAASAAELLVIDRRQFFAAMERDPQLARNAIALLCDRLRWVSARLEDSALRSAPERLARMLGYLAADHGREVEGGVEIAIGLTQTDLARWVMMSRESLNKTLSRWADDGLLSHDRSRILLLDPERLTEIAEFGEAD